MLLGAISNTLFFVGFFFLSAMPERNGGSDMDRMIRQKMTILAPLQLVIDWPVSLAALYGLFCRKPTFVLPLVIYLVVSSALSAILAVLVMTNPSTTMSILTAGMGKEQKEYLQMAGPALAPSMAITWLLALCFQLWCANIVNNAYRFLKEEPKDANDVAA